MPHPAPEPTPHRDLAARDGIVLVTGAAGGIGRAVVARLLTAGQRVVATDVDAAALEQLATEHGPGTAADGLLHTSALDIRDAAAIDALVERLERDHRRIEGLVNAAGILRAGSALAQDDKDWAAMHDVNVGGVMRVSRAVARRMAVRHRGAIVTVASNSAAVARDGLSAYAATKAAARQYTLCLGIELAPLGIRCNVVSPGSTNTPMLTGAWSSDASDHADSAEVAAAIGAAERRAVAGTPEAFWPGIPLGRIAQPQHVADAVAFLLSPQAAHIALHDLRVDGGATLGA